jgi:eukaryotic-like serine/threonine-protein kinase
MHAVMGSGRLIAGRYRLEGQIGRGAMGIVWRGRDELLARDVAVKEVQITALASPAEAESIYQRTLREARAAARLTHPAAVTVFDVVAEDGSPWIVMELVNGRSLDRVIIEDGPLAPLQAAELGATLVGALASAHAAGVLHRDVKPSNVLVADEGRTVLTDFGIATFATDAGTTQVGMVVGTPGFTAPERVRGGAATPASDLWSLGATLYAAVEGRGPFDRLGGPTAITAGVATQDAPRAPSAGPLGPVIDALLSRDPAARPDVTTAARLLTESAAAARTAPRRQWLVAGQIIRDGAPTAAGSTEQRAPFLDPPVFAAQASYGPVLWEPLKPSAGGPGGNRAADGNAATGAGVPGGMGSGGDSGTGGSGTGGSGTGGSGTGGSGTGGSGGGDWLGFMWRGDAARPAAARWKLMVATAGVAAIALAAVVGWDTYSRSPSPQALVIPAVLGPGSAQYGPSPSSHLIRGTPAARLPAPTTSTGANNAGSGHSGVPGSSPAGSRSPSSSSSPGPSHSPSPTPTTTKKPSPSPTPTTTKKPSPSPTPTTTKKPSPSPTPTTTKKPSPSPTPTTKKPSSSPTPTSTKSPSPSPKPA